MMLIMDICSNEIYYIHHTKSYVPRNYLKVLFELKNYKIIHLKSFFLKKISDQIQIYLQTSWNFTQIESIITYL